MEKFITALKNVFGNRLVAVLGYGSFFNKQDDAVDVDLVIVLDKQHLKDSEAIEKAYTDSKIGKPLSRMLAYNNYILENGVFFSINTCGPFFLKTIKSAIVLFGSNPFQKIKDPGELVVDISTLQKLQQYVYQFGSYQMRREHSSFFTKFANKRLKFMLLGLSNIAGKDYRNILDKKTLKSIDYLLKKALYTNSDVSKIIYFSQVILSKSTSICHEKYNLKYV